jgi:uncharacterized protein (TIGR03437 family)
VQQAPRTGRFFGRIGIGLKHDGQFQMFKGPVFVRQAAALLFLACQFGVAATLSAPGQTTGPGQSVVVPLSFTASGSTIAGIQFDLQWSKPFTLSVAVGSQLAASTKVLYTAPIQTGTLRCLIAGVNGDLIPEGVLLNVTIGVDYTATAGTDTINIANLIAVNPSGTAAAVTSSPLSIQIQTSNSPPLPTQSLVNAASMVSGSVSPGEIVSLFAPIGAGTPALLFNGAAAPILYAGANQLNAIVPFGLDVTQPVLVQLQNGATTAGTATVNTAAVGPALFTLSSGGAGPGAILNQDYSVNSASNPALRGSYIMLYGTGFGLLSASVADGSIVNAAVNFAVQPIVSISGVQAEVTYAGSAYGLVAGLAQINVQVPKNIAANSNAPVLVKVGSALGQSGVTVAIK